MLVSRNLALKQQIIYLGTISIACVLLLSNSAYKDVRVFEEESQLPRRKAIETSKSWWRGIQPEHQINETDYTSNGARHPNGTLGMIVDPSPERLRLPLDDPTNNPLICPMSKGTNASSVEPGFEGKGANLVLQKVRRGVLNSQAYLRNQTLEKGLRAVGVNKTVQERKSRILCMIYTVYIPGNNHSNVRAQAETWGRQCDGFIAASNFTDHSIGAIDLVHKGREEYGNMWQKTRSMLAYAYNHYLEDFDFFHLCGDDVYIVMDNLRSYLDGPEVLRLENGYIDKIASGKKFRYDENIKKQASARPRPLIFGSPYNHRGWPVIAGGPGYTLNRAALRIFGERSLPRHFTDIYSSREDIFVASSLLREGIAVSDTKDAKDGDRYGGAADTIYNFKGVGPIGTKVLTRRFGLKYNTGIDSCSEQYVAFHLKESKRYLIKINRTIDELMHRYHVVLNGLCQN